MKHLCQAVPPVCKVGFPLNQVERPSLRELQMLADGLVRLLVSHDQRHLRQPRKSVIQVNAAWPHNSG